MKLRAIIVDDEAPARENLKFLLQDYCPEVEVVGTAESVRTARELIEKVSPQVIFLDIRMPSGAEGFELLESLPEKKFQVVFVTAFKDYAIKAFNANAIHYILKPVDIDDLKAAVRKLVATNELFQNNSENFRNYVTSLENLTRNMNMSTNVPPKRITIHHAKGFKIIDPEDIMYLEGEGNYTNIYFKDRSKYTDTKTLGIYEDILDASKFFRIHKSNIVNLAFVKEYLNENGFFAVLKDDTRLNISRQRLNEFLDLFKSGKVN